jgi:hypothetical protein
LHKQINMPFTTSVSISQGADCSQFTIADSSTYNVEGTGTFSARKLTIQKSDGTYLVVGSVTYNQYVWPFASGNSITISNMQIDSAFTIKLELTSTSPQSGSIYSKIELPVLTCYTMSAFFSNTYKMSIDNSLEKDYKFVKDVMRLFMEQESAKKAGADGDVGAAQGCLDRAKQLSDALKIGY